MQSGRRRFENKIVALVGAGMHEHGLTNGAAAALAYARDGGFVYCLDRDQTAADRTVDEIQKAGGDAQSVAVDATDLDGLQNVASRIVEAHGQVDVLHNNVGATIMGGPTDLSEQEFQAAINLNLGTVYLACKAFLPHMVAAGTGAIVNIASLGGMRWSGYTYFGYSVAKAGVIQATQSIAMEHAKSGIRANCIAPGAIDTPLIHRQIIQTYGSAEEMQESRRAAIPLGYCGQPEDVAAAALFLASDEAKFITGVCLTVDGGQSCQCGPPLT